GAIFFINVPSLLIVVGGTFSAGLINFPLSEFLGAIKVAKNAFLYKQIQVNEIIEKMVELARKARVEGLLSLEKEINDINDEFIKKGLQMMVDGTESDILRDVLTTELSCLEDRHETGQEIFKALGSFAPAMGMAGTLIGLIQMLQQLSDPSQIGSGMATAMITTFYGVLMANLMFIPIAGKLKLRTKQEILIKQLVIEAISSIQAGDNPRLLRDKLVTFIAPKHRTFEEGGE
ncbi:motility protein A, partial [candidate division KSB1 bacterium]